MLTKREQQVLDCIRSDPMATQQAIADRLGLSRSAVALHVMNLGNKGVIRGRGYVLREDRYVVAVGGANVDISGRVSSALRRGDSNPGSNTIGAGGVARNVAENLVRLGLPCRLLSIVGDDSHGDFLLEHCRRAGIDVDGVLRSAGGRTSTYVAVIDGKSQLDIGIADTQIMEQLDGSALERHSPGISAASAVFVDANLGEDALDTLFSSFGDKLIVADPVSAAKAPKLRPYLPSIDILKPTLAEAAAILQRPLRNRRQAATLARSLCERGVGEVYLSCGEHGLRVHAGHEAFHLPAPETPGRASVSGAGDAMTAAILDARVAGLSVADAARRGIAAAGVALSAMSATANTLSAASVDAQLEAVGSA